MSRGGDSFGNFFFLGGDSFGNFFFLLCFGILCFTKSLGDALGDAFLGWATFLVGLAKGTKGTKDGLGEDGLAEDGSKHGLAESIVLLCNSRFFLCMFFLLSSRTAWARSATLPLSASYLSCFSQAPILRSPFSWSQEAGLVGFPPALDGLDGLAKEGLAENDGLAEDGLAIGLANDGWIGIGLILLDGLAALAKDGLIEEGLGLMEEGLAALAKDDAI
jgi:hypothetical protein